MLNRRILRIKAMQNLYAFNQARHSDFQLALDVIEKNFRVEWDTAPEEAENLKADQKAALEIFKAGFEKQDFASGRPVSEKVSEAIQEASDFYRAQLRKDADHLKNAMIKSAEKISDLYLWTLKLLIEIAEFPNIEQKEKERKFAELKKPFVKSSGELNLYHNKTISKLKEDASLQKMINDRKISWTNHRDKVRHWYKEIVKKTELYNEYIRKENPTFEEDKAMIVQIVKHIVFKNEAIDAFMQEQDLYWQEDKAIIRSMTLKTVRSAEKDRNFLELAALSNNWEDDKEYFRLLFENTVKNQKEYEQILAKKIRNWDIDRIAALDNILLQMAISEMINFPSIPIKVTINEYIEISKMYSTPKSKQFINGILDVVASELVADGVIRKSGRGLIDNK